MARIKHIQVTIPAGQALSELVDIGGYELVAVGMPSSWTAAALTFRASLDGATELDVATESGELSLTVAASQYCALSPGRIVGAGRIRVRSGTASAGVNQLADRILTLVLMTLPH